MVRLSMVGNFPCLVEIHVTHTLFYNYYLLTEREVCACEISDRRLEVLADTSAASRGRHENNVLTFH